MSKIIRKTTAILLSFTLMLSSSIVAFAYYDDEAYDTSKRDYLVSVYGYGFMRNYYSSLERIREIYNFLPRNRMGEVIYPEHHAGIYIDHDGNLVILVVGSEIPDTRAVPAQAEGVIVREVAVSYHELSQTIDQITYVITSDDKWHSHVSAWFIDVVNNRIVVELADYSYENMAIFREGVLDSPLVTFAPCIGRLYIEQKEVNPDIYPIFPEETGFAPFSTLFPGSAVAFYRPGQNGMPGRPMASGSIGYLGNHQGRAGFVTAAHIGGRLSEGGLRVGDLALNFSTGARIGIVRNVALQNLDAAFVELDNVNTLSRNLPSGGGQTATYAWMGVGAIVTAIGQTSGLRTGRIEIASTNVTAATGPNYDRLTFTVRNAIRASIRSDSGDSGGIVYTPEGTWSQPRNPIVGIVVSGQSNITTISNALNINNMNSGLRVNLR